MFIIREKRKKIISYYDNHLIDLNLPIHYCSKWMSSGHLYLTRIPSINIEQRNNIILQMAEQGIACNVHYKPLPMLTAYKNLSFNINSFPNAYNQYANEISLPLYTNLTNENIEYIIDKYTTIIKANI